MGLFQFECESCGEIGDVVCRHSEKADMVCPECGHSPLQFPLVGYNFVGRTDRTIRSQAFGRTFESYQALEKYAESRGYYCHGDDESGFKKRMQTVRENCEQRALREGYSSREQKMEHKKHQKARKRGRVDGKIYSI